MKFSKAEIDAVIAASPRTTVPFNKLVLSPGYQARPAGTTSRLSVAELAASIKANDLFHNLIVVKGGRGLHEVCAGGRRLEALTLLVDSGDLPENYPVPVMIVPADKALMASLVENVQREPLHPADELVGFTRLIAEGKSVEDVAAAFGVTPLVVKRRLKLAAVSPKLMAQFRDGQIGLDCLMVLASVDDHEKQEQTLAHLPSWNRNAEHLRRLLTQGEIESDKDPVARFVTIKAYEEAGGALRRDLFSDGRPRRTCSMPGCSRGWRWKSCRNGPRPCMRADGSGSMSARVTSTMTTSSTANCERPVARQPPTKPSSCRCWKGSRPSCTNAWKRSPTPRAMRRPTAGSKRSQSCSRSASTRWRTACPSGRPT